MEETESYRVDPARRMQEDVNIQNLTLKRKMIRLLQGKAAEFAVKKDIDEGKVPSNFSGIPIQKFIDASRKGDGLADIEIPKPKNEKEDADEEAKKAEEAALKKKKMEPKKKQSSLDKMKNRKMADAESKAREELLKKQEE